MQLEEKQISDMQRHIDAASRSVNVLREGYRSPEKVNTLLDTTMQQIEISCLELRRLCESIRPRIPHLRQGTVCYHSKAIYGEVTLMETGWLHIRLNTLLPHYRALGGTQYVADSITRLLNHFQSNGGCIPEFGKAFVAIIEHCNFESCGAYDHDNKSYQAVINALKGRLYPDDNQFEMSLGLFNVVDEEACCHIYILPDEEAGDFLYSRSSWL